MSNQPISFIKIINPGFSRRKIKTALFDFDGTLSLIRQGCMDVMVPMMVEELRSVNPNEDVDKLAVSVRESVYRLTGKQTIYQMKELADQIRKRGAIPLDPIEYKHRYIKLLWDRIAGRVAGLNEGSISPEDMMVPGSINLLKGLRQRGVRLYLASGTDELPVQDEAAALGISEYFEGIYGAREGQLDFDKDQVIRMILEENRLDGSELLGFGDGFVEIEEVKKAGGVAIGVASNESERKGWDDWKCQRLERAGADLIIPDYRESEGLLSFLFDERG